MRIEHATWDEIIVYVTGQAAGDASAESHIGRCPACRRTAEIARELVAALELAGMRAPSEELMRRTWEKMRATGEAGVEPGPLGAAIGSAARGVGRLAGKMREIAAVLVSDSRVPAGALRTSATLFPRMLVYEAGPYAISVSIAPGTDEQTLVVRGQVVPKEGTALPAGGTAQASAGGEAKVVPLSTFGEFQFDGLPAGEIRVRILVAGTQIDLAAISGGASR